MKKLLIFLMMALPVIIIIVLNAAILVVTDIVPIPVEKVELEYSTVVTNIASSYVLKPNIFPTNASNKDLIWESSDENVIMVDQNGAITFVGFGSAYITVSSLESNKQDSCYFVVTDTSVHQVLLYTIGNQNTCEIGQSLTMYAHVLPAEAVNQGIVFSSTNEDVATVNSSGIVYGLSSGTTTIVAKSADGGHVSSMDVEVFQPVTAITMTTNSILSEESYCQLSYSVLPINADTSKLIFSLDDDSIASVNNFGRVVFIKAGVVNVSIEYKDIKKVCRVQFTDGYASTLDLPYNTINCNYDDIEFQLEYSTIPENLYNTNVEFASSNSAVATVNESGLVQLEGGGICTLSVIVEKSDGTFITKDITLVVERKCEQIETSDFTTAIASTQIECEFLPADNTCESFYYHCDSLIATVSEDGIIRFNAIGQATVIVYANEDYSQIYGQTVITYTGGYATNFDVPNRIELTSGENYIISPTYLPTNVLNKDLIFTILSQQCQDGTVSGVISVSSNGHITAQNGGNAEIKISLKIGEAEYIEKTINVVVKQFVLELNLQCQLEQFNDEYVSSNQIVEFFSSYAPLSATETEIEYSIDDTNACRIYNNTLIFNYPALVTLTVKNVQSNISNSIKIRYTSTILDVNFVDVPTQIYVGDSIEIKVANYIPSTLDCEIILQKTGENTKAKGSVVVIDKSLITAVNGGTVNIAIYISGIYRTSINLEVIRLSSSIDIYPKNIQITNSVLNLFHTISPIDTTSNDVVWSVDNTFIASIVEDILVFTGYGKVTITAMVQDENAASLTFTIERLQADSQNVSPSEQDYEMYRGQYIHIENPSISAQYSIASDGGEEIIEVNNQGLVHALSAGNVLLKCTFFDAYGIITDIYEMNITVLNYVENILLDNTIFEQKSGEYLTAQEENLLSYTLYPQQNVRNEIEFTLSNTTIAAITNNKLVFYSVGTVELRAKSIDENCVKVWTIRYTGGYANDVELNVENSFNLAKGESITFEVNRWIPSNTVNKNLSLELLTEGAEQIVSVNGLTITTLKGGLVRILVRASDVVTKTIILNVKEDLSQIKFEFEELVTAESEYMLSPTFIPSTTTSRGIYYLISDNQIATEQNGILTFSKPGTVEVTVISETDENIWAKCFVTSTMGYPKQIVLNESDITLVVGQICPIYLTSYSPRTTQRFELEYTITSSTPSISGTNVISLSSNGVIEAQNGGFATVCVSVVNPYNANISAFVTVEVKQNVSAIDVVFEKQVDIVRNVYVTSDEELGYSVSFTPADATSRDYTYVISDTSYATIQDETIKFLKSGIISITYTSSSNVNISKTITINYTNNSCVYAQVDESSFVTQPDQTKQISLLSGQIFDFEITRTIPYDISYVDLEITQLASYPNNPSFEVAKIANGRIELLNGGKAIFNLKVNGYDMGNYTFVSIKKCTSIQVESDVVYVSTPNYAINAKALPLDASNTDLTYQCSNSLLATVNAIGEVEFFGIGSVDITITNTASTIQRVIKINYTKNIEKITITASKTILSEGSTIVLGVSVYPSGVPYAVEFVSSDPTIATVDANGRIIAQNKTGYVTIIAYVVGSNDVYTSETFYVSRFVTNIALELDSVGDDQGIKGERVFGKYFIDSSNNFYNTYHMNVLSIVPADTDSALVWSTSDSSIATVDANGLVTFLNSGTVTIRVEPQAQYNISRPVYDSYTFTIIDAVNVYSFEDFYLCMTRSKSVVLQDDAELTQDFITKKNLIYITINGSIYGNGHMISLSGLNGFDNKLVVSKSGTIIDNVILRGEKMNTNGTLSELTDKNVLMIVWCAKNIVIKNSILENALTNIRIWNSEVTLSGCILRNAGLTNVMLTQQDTTIDQTIVTAKNCVFADALFGSILFDFDKPNATISPKLIIVGNLSIYNFRQPSEMICALVEEYVPGISEQIGEVLSLCENIKHLYKGKAYFELGIMSLNVSGMYSSTLDVDMTQLTGVNPYRLSTVSGLVSPYGFGALYFSMEIYTVMPNNGQLSPASTYNSTIYETIRDNS